MMKREYAAAAVLALLVALSAWNSAKLAKLTEDMEVAVCKSRSAAEQLSFRRSRDYLEEGLTLWEQAEGYTQVFLPREQVEKTYEDFRQLQQLLAQEDAPASAALFDALKDSLSSLRESEKVSVGSVL